MTDIGGEVLDGRCECKTDPCTWQVPLDEDGYKRESGTRGWYVFGYVPQGMFCKRCGSELRADGTALTRLRLPEADALDDAMTTQAAWDHQADEERNNGPA